MKLGILRRVRRITNKFAQKSYSYSSGERQTSTSYESIRKDHRNRYDFACEHIIGDALSGLDCFCGNGYGTQRIAHATGAEILGIDGSQEAIEVARDHFCGDRIAYRQALFPFELPLAVYDFVVCFETIEHVLDAARLFETLSGSLKPGGILLISFPTEEKLPFARNRDYFGFHIRHFLREDIMELAGRQGLSHVAEAGQNVYRTKDGVVLGMLEDEAIALVKNNRNAQFALHIFRKPE